MNLKKVGYPQKIRNELIILKNNKWKNPLVDGGKYLFIWVFQLIKGNKIIDHHCFCGLYEWMRIYGHLVSLAADITKCERTRHCGPHTVLPKIIMEMMTKVWGTLAYRETPLVLRKGSNLGLIQSLHSAANLQEIQNTRGTSWTAPRVSKSTKCRRWETL